LSGKTFKEMMFELKMRRYSEPRESQANDLGWEHAIRSDQQGDQYGWSREGEQRSLK
jgi:hypothetical protein